MELAPAVRVNALAPGVIEVERTRADPAYEPERFAESIPAGRVGRPEDVVQVRDVAERVADRLGAPLTFAEGAGPDIRNYQVDFTKIFTALPAFAPQWTVDRGIEQLAHDMRERDLQLEDFEGPKFVRLARIRELIHRGLLDDTLHNVDLPRRSSS